MCADAFLRSAAWRASLTRILECVRSRLHSAGGNAAPLLQPWREYGQQSGDARSGQSPVCCPTHAASDCAHPSGTSDATTAAPRAM